MTIQIPLYLQKKLTPSRSDRQMLGDVFLPGAARPMDLVPSSSGTTRGITIGPGAAYVPGTQIAYQGVYRFFSDSAVVLSHDAATSNPRLDQIILRVQDSAENSNVGPDVGTIEIAKGTETSGATLLNRSGAVADASMPANWLRIADVLITPGMSLLPAANISDRRAMARGPEMPRIVGGAGQPAFATTWAAGSGGGRPRFWKDFTTGLVYLAGYARRPTAQGTGTNLIFTLPLGYRPAEETIFALHSIAGSSSAADVTVSPDGTVKINNDGSDAYAYLDGLYFDSRL